MSEQCCEQQEERSVLAFQDDCLVIVGHRARVLHTLAVGDLLDLFIAGCFQRVRVCSGGGRSLYYETENGLRGRFATSMRARFIASAAQKEVSSSEPATTTLATASVQITAATPGAQKSALASAEFTLVRCPVERVSFLHYSVSRFIVCVSDPPVSCAFVSEQEQCA
jgi:hypothetical protein